MPSVPLLPEAEQFDGTGWPAFKTKIIAHLKARELGGYIDGTILNPSPAQAERATTATDPAAPADTALPPEPTVVYSRNPSLKEFLHRDGIASSILVQCQGPHWRRAQDG
jgi:hypothetical protein